MFRERGTPATAPAWAQIRASVPMHDRGTVPLTYDQRRCFSVIPQESKLNKARRGRCTGACCSCLWPLYAKLGISHSQAGGDRPEVREINARLGHFIIVILFFQTLPLTFNFAPELIVCSLQYD